MAREFGNARALMIIGIIPAVVLMILSNEWIARVLATTLFGITAAFAFLALGNIAYIWAVLVGGLGLVWVYRVSRATPVDRGTNLVVLVTAAVILAPVLRLALKG